MRLINERINVVDVAKRWRAQYPKGSAPDKEAIYQALKKLDTSKATATDIEKIIGNRSWAGAYACQECRRPVTEVVEIGEPPDYDSSTAQVCGRCLAKALKLISSAAQNKVAK